MMKRNILAVVIPALLVAGAANAAEIYNKDGNKLDLYGKLLACITSLIMTATMATKLTRVWASKAKLRSTISWLVTVSGNTTSRVTTLKAPMHSPVTKPVWHSQV